MLNFSKEEECYNQAICSTKELFLKKITYVGKRNHWQAQALFHLESVMVILREY